MLVLKRTISQTFKIKLPSGEVITVMVTNVRGNVVDIGIDAPRSIQIVRAELEEH